MNIVRYILDIIFVLTLIALAFLPREGKIRYVFWLILFVNIGIRVFLIVESHRKARKVDDLEERLEIEKDTVRDFQAKLEVTFSGKWAQDKKPYPGRMISPVTHEYYIVLEKSRSNKENEKITFYAVEEYKFKDAGEGRAVFNARVAVHSGNYPLGKLLKEIVDYDKIMIRVPLILSKNIEDQKILVENVKIDFLINGENAGTFAFDEKNEVNVKPRWASFVLQGDRILPILRLTE